MIKRPRYKKSEVADSHREWRLSIRKEMIRFHGSKCQICGITFDGANTSIFDFHHTDPSKKTADWNNNQALNTRLEQSKDCIMVCANCHRQIHAGELPFLSFPFLRADLYSTKSTKQSEGGWF
jgi:predicted HNH restriction endonuclease